MAASGNSILPFFNNKVRVNKFKLHLNGMLYYDI